MKKKLFKERRYKKQVYKFEPIDEFEKELEPKVIKIKSSKKKVKKDDFKFNIDID